MKLATISNGKCLALATWVFVLLWTLLFACFSLDIPLVTRPPTLCKLWCAASMRLRICWNSFQYAATSQAKCARLNAVLPRLIHSTIAPVMCGTTCTVLPKYFPSRSCSRTSFYTVGVRTPERTHSHRLEQSWTNLRIYATKQEVLLNDWLVNLASREVVVPAAGNSLRVHFPKCANKTMPPQGKVHHPLVVAQIQVCLSTVI